MEDPILSDIDVEQQRQLHIMYTQAALLNAGWTGLLTAPESAKPTRPKPPNIFQPPTDTTRPPRYTQEALRKAGYDHTYGAAPESAYDIPPRPTRRVPTGF